MVLRGFVSAIVILVHTLNFVQVSTVIYRLYEFVRLCVAYLFYDFIRHLRWTNGEEFRRIPRCRYHVHIDEKRSFGAHKFGTMNSLCIIPYDREI